MFWGLTIEPGKHYTQTVDESFHVSMAALETRDVASPERDKVKMTQLMVQHDKAEFLVCTLSYASNIFQQYLDLNFTEGEEVTFFSEGRATIHLTGYLVRDEPMSMDPDMMSMDEASSSDEAASNSEGLASGEESSGEARVKVERSYQLQRVRQRRRSQKVSYSDVRQRQRKQFIWPDRQLLTKKRKVPPVINLEAETFISRKRNVGGYVDDETLRGTVQRSKGSLRHRSVRVSKKQSLLTERIPSYCNWSETPSTALAHTHADSPMTSGTQEAINQLETAKTSSIGGHLVSFDLTGTETNSPSTDEQGHPFTTPTTASTIAKTNLPTPKNQLTHASDAKDCTSYVGFPGTRKEIRQAKECPEKHVSLSRGTVPSIRSKHRGVVKAGRLNYHQSITARSKYHSTKPHSGQSSAGYTTSASHRKRTQRGAGFLTFSRGQPTPTRHSRINLPDTSDSTLMGGGASQPIISNVVGGPEAAVMRRTHFENTAQKNIGGQARVLQIREFRTDGGNSEVLEIHNPSAVEVPQEQSGQSSTTIFQAPLAVSGLKEEQSGSTTEQVPSMTYTSNLVPTSLIVAYPGESNPHPRPGAGVQGFAMPETDSVYWSCMADDTGVGTGASTSDGIPVASDMTSLTAFDLNSSAINMPDQKIRLAHGFDVFIMRRDLLQAERASKQSWSIFVRRLLDVLFDRVTLAMGRASNFGASHSERTPLDQNVVEALKAFFKARFNINKRELMQAIGYYCHDLRYKMMQELQSM
ncbi:uncharacterized protein LOC117295239 isoform X1 [Asterias rubens]|uniref:uncharacterized protein LOC117295239 isoform X1 n=1 Tax=Asterias rubens TaxID=7604 RepID=UPI001454E487|nr:uncharacterized protein LOC117295239 isoform X1 [Asterias rubens]